VRITKGNGKVERRTKQEIALKISGGRKIVGERGPTQTIREGREKRPKLGRGWNIGSQGGKLARKNRGEKRG